MVYKLTLKAAGNTQRHAGNTQQAAAKCPTCVSVVLLTFPTSGWKRWHQAISIMRTQNSAFAFLLEIIREHRGRGRHVQRANKSALSPLQSSSQVRALLDWNHVVPCYRWAGPAGALRGPGKGQSPWMPETFALWTQDFQKGKAKEDIWPIDNDTPRN